MTNDRATAPEIDSAGFVVGFRGRAARAVRRGEEHGIFIRSDPDHFHGHVERRPAEARELPDRKLAPVAGPHELCDLSAGINEMLNSLERSAAEVAKRRADEQALRERLRHTEKMAAIGTLAAGMVHDMSSPLTLVTAGLGEIDLLVNNAGLALGRDPFTESTEEDERTVLAMDALAELRSRLVDVRARTILSISDLDDERRRVRLLVTPRLEVRAPGRRLRRRAGFSGTLRQSPRFQDRAEGPARRA